MRTDRLAIPWYTRIPDFFILSYNMHEVFCALSLTSYSSRTRIVLISLSIFLWMKSLSLSLSLKATSLSLSLWSSPC